MDEQKVIPERQGSVLTGVIGAVIGAMIGAVVWAVVYSLGYVASIVGLLIGVLASKGYDLLHGRKGNVKVVVLVLCVILAVIVGHAGAYAWILHDTYQEEVAAMSAVERLTVMTESEFFQMAAQDLLDDGEFIGEAVKDLAVGLAFAFLGCFGMLKQQGGSKKKRKAKDGADTQQ